MMEPEICFADLADDINIAERGLASLPQILCQVLLLKTVQTI
jgi:hypothetical protein